MMLKQLTLIAKPCTKVFTDTVMDRSVSLPATATYAVNAIQVRQTDAVGNVSDISKNTSPIVIDTTDPIFERQSTVVNANINSQVLWFHK
jgi:hypothetical protein